MILDCTECNTAVDNWILHYCSEKVFSFDAIIALQYSTKMKEYKFLSMYCIYSIQ